MSHDSKAMPFARGAREHAPPRKFEKNNAI